MKYIADNVELETIEEVVEKILDDMNDGYFDDYLDEVYGEIEICGVSYYASNVLKEVDETAYNVYKNDYKDSLYSDVYAEVENISSGGKERIYDTNVECIDDDDDDVAEDNSTYETLLFS